LTAPYRILVIEDNAGDLYLLNQAFSSVGLRCELTAFSDGEEALRHVRTTGSTEGLVQPDLVLLDLHLPKIDGTTILQEIRVSPFMARTPVVVLSSSLSHREREQVSAYAVAGLLVKPVDLDAFLLIGEKIQEVLRETSARDKQWT
jgi:CheY-like chemotaxis protein